MESLNEILIIFPLVFGLVLALHSFLCIVVFYHDFASYVQQQYFCAVEIENVLKFQAKFKRILSAIDGME